MQMLAIPFAKIIITILNDWWTNADAVSFPGMLFSGIQTANRRDQQADAAW